MRRVRGPHCYEIYGEAAFDEIMAKEPGTFFLTDFLVSQFDALVIQELGLDRHPELRDAYFGNYRRVVLSAKAKPWKTRPGKRRGGWAFHLRSGTLRTAAWSHGSWS